MPGQKKKAGFERDSVGWSHLRGGCGDTCLPVLDQTETNTGKRKILILFLILFILYILIVRKWNFVHVSYV